jgi:hypothetical protein
LKPGAGRAMYPFVFVGAGDDASFHSHIESVRATESRLVETGTIFRHYYVDDERGVF